MIQASSTQKIQVLPKHLIDQIKAGEVIERPAAIVKELIENSLDAQAKNIDVQIDDGGLTLISICDDGFGMKQDELPLAFTRHATSKITRFEDLYRLSSFGFRGEALAGLASVARVICTAIPQDIPSLGGKIEFHGGEQIFLGPFHGGNHGTSIYVRDLFYNTPARLKFIRSKKTEIQQIKKILLSFLLTHPETSFSVRWNQQDKELYPAVATNQYIKRVEQLLGKRLPTFELTQYHDEFQGHHIHAIFMKHVGSKINDKISNKFQFLFANKRFFQDRKIHYLLTNALNEHLPNIDSDFVLYMDIPPSELDVNVHPNKTEIKFAEPQIIHALTSGLAKRFGQSQQEINVPLVNSRNLENQDFQNWQTSQSMKGSQTSQEEQTQKTFNLPTIFELPQKTFIYHVPHAATYLVRPFSALELLLRARLEKAHFPLGEDNIFPILIGIPIPLSDFKDDEKFKSFLTLLNVAGFEATISVPDCQRIILRTFPQYFHGFPLAPLCEKFLPLLWKKFLQTPFSISQLKNEFLSVINQFSEGQWSIQDAHQFILCPAFQEALHQKLYSQPLDELFLRGIFAEH
ncbi:MAG: DNA mismatch repair endonuclease MutL [Bdellovibrio sp.]|nr:DNA mismatch repair endonuclease MutL [Bdellovibrio sp.]